MALKRKVLISVRLPGSLVERADFVARNIDNEQVKNRSAAIQTALESWLPSQEERLERLGVIPKKGG